MMHREASLNNQVTQDNYYNNENDFKYLSKSVFWQFLNEEGGCEAGALAQLEGKYDPFKSKEPLLFGNYLHSYFESKEAHEKFINDNERDLFKYGKKDKGLKKSYQSAQKCIETLNNDKNFKELYKGDKEVIVTGKIGGVQWKGKIDCLDLENNRFYDLKTVQDIHKKFWIPSQSYPTDFVIARGYDMQMAIYKELIKQTFNEECDPYIIAVSKQEEPDKAIIQVDNERMEERMRQVKNDQPRVKDIIQGNHGLIRPCGKCEWCRMHKQLNTILTAGEIELN